AAAVTLTFSVTANNGVASTTSSPVNVTVNAPSIALNATTADPGQTVTATVANGPGNALDWVGLYPAGATSAVANRLAIRYLNGSTTAPTTGVSAAAINFTLPTTPDRKSTRLNLNNVPTAFAVI